MNFQIGDIVRLKTGTCEQEVTKVDTHRKRISTQYLNSHHTQQSRRAKDFVLVSSNSPKEDHMTPNTLFQTKENKPRYGHYIATNPEGRIVLAMDYGYEDFDPNQLEEVIPHTVMIQGTNGNNYHYQVPAEKLKVGDIVVFGTKLGRVAEVNTKNKSAQILPKETVKVATVPIDG